MDKNALRLIEIKADLAGLPLDGLEGSSFYSVLAKRMKLHQERAKIFELRNAAKKQNEKINEQKNGK